MKRILMLLVVCAPVTSLADRSINTGKGGTIDCAQDDDVSINISSGTFTFKGACKDIHVNGSSNKLTVESVDDLSVNGSGNTVAVTATDDINVNGSNNTVTYAKGIKRATPKVGNLGTKNTITAAASGGPPAATVTAPTAGAPATNETVLDCDKTKKVSIAKSKGSYRVIGACEKVAIMGGSNRVSIDTVKHLAITGAKNDITVGSADKIATTGANNSVAYGSAVKITTLGKNNKVTQSSAAATGAAPAPAAPAPTVAATVSGPGKQIDCGKTPTFTINDNNGSFTINGTCELIQINGNRNTLRIAAAKGVSVAGNHNDVSVLAVDALSVSGNDNKASWKTGLSAAKAKVASPGNRNSVTQMK